MTSIFDQICVPFRQWHFDRIPVNWIVLLLIGNAYKCLLCIIMASPRIAYLLLWIIGHELDFACVKREYMFLDRAADWICWRISPLIADASPGQLCSIDRSFGRFQGAINRVFFAIGHRWHSLLVALVSLIFIWFGTAWYEIQNRL